MDVEKLLTYGFPERYVEILRNRGIHRLNPVQRNAVRRGLFKGRNLVVVAPTASGKTLIGELALLFNTLYRRRLGFYLVPLRALASEKYEEFKVFEDLGLRVGITTGDYESPAEYLGRYDVVVATYERFDSLLRLKPRWLNRLGVVVIDELHMVNDVERGPILEMIIARLLSRNIQLIGLSATIGNPHVLAKWINGELVDDPYRPVELIEGVYDRGHGVIVFTNGKTEKIIHRIGNSALNIALQSITNGLQVLVFVHNRRKAEEWAFKLTEHLGLFKHMIDSGKVRELISMLRDSPSSIEREKLSYLIERGVAYHHAGLSMVARRVVEKGFRDRVIRVVFATPTLAAGVNLPARRVLVSIKRYSPVRRRMVNIAVYEYKQMAGRAGRPSYDPYGEAIIYDASSISEGLKFIRGSLEPVTSKLNNERNLRIHVLSLIASNDANTLEEIVSVFRNTLLAMDNFELSYIESSIKNIIEDLIDWGMVNEHHGKYVATLLGRTTTITYLDPMSVKRYLENITEKPGDLYLLTLITSTPDYVRSRPYISYRVIELFEDEALDMADQKLIPPPPKELDEYGYYSWMQSYVHARMLHDWINEVSEDQIIEEYGVGPGDIYSARDTASWISGALSRIEGILGNSSRAEKLSRLSTRLEYGVREDALELIKLQGIGRVRARTLIKHGIKSLEDLAKTPPSRIESLPGFGPRIVKSIYEQLKSMGLT